MKKTQAETNLPHYLEAAKAWETDEISRTRNSERRAWRVAIGACILAVLAVAAVALLAPLKEVEPFVVRVDKLGESDVVTLLDERTVTASEALDKYWLSTYVNFREEYSDSLAYGNFQATQLMSSQPVRDEFFGQVRPDRPQSPTAIYGKEGTAEVEVNSVSFIADGHAQVRFTREAKLAGAQAPSVTQWIATVSYDYINPPMDQKARLINPVGFRVKDYRVDQDTTPDPHTTGGS